MNFESMIGTTGIASNGDILFVANNKVITKIDSRTNVIRDVPHGFDRIEDIDVFGDYLAGIYVKNEVYGIFLMDLRTSEYKTYSSLKYEPYRIGFVNMGEERVFVYGMDNKQAFYFYDMLLTTEEKGKDFFSGGNRSFNEVDMAIVEGERKDAYMMSTTEVTPLGDKTQRANIQVEGELLTMKPYLHYLFIAYLSHYNMYSVIQYDTKTKSVVKELDGGYFSTRVYMCVHRYELFISSTLNKIFPLNSFSLSTDELGSNKNEYPLFLENSLVPNLEEVELTIDLAKLNERKQSFSVDTKTAESSLFNYYIWAIIATIFIVLIYVSFMTPPTGTVNIILLLVLVAVVIFIIHSNI